MLFIVVVLALVMYCGLYLMWEAAQSQLDGTASILRAFNNMLFMPQDLVFVIFRGLVLLAIFYVLADLFLTSAKRVKRRRPITQTLKSTFNEDDSHTHRE